MSELWVYAIPPTTLWVHSHKRFNKILTILISDSHEDDAHLYVQTSNRTREPSLHLIIASGKAGK